jgi:photosystem II stability/assembly factor-like uncharacterized protein
MARDDALLAASHTGDILRSADRGATWRVVGQARGALALLLSPATADGWIGTVQGALLVSHDAGATWQAATSPCPGQSILAIAASPTYAQDRSLLLGAATPAGSGQQSRLSIWRSADAGGSWRQAATHATPAGWLAIVIPPAGRADPAAQAILATGQHALYPSPRDGGAWVATTVEPSGASVLGLAACANADRQSAVFAATGTGVFRSTNNGRTWELFTEGLALPTPPSLDPRTPIAPSLAFVSLALVDRAGGRSLYALSLGGVVWRRAL